MDDIKNVVLITIDTLRQDHVGCFGYREGTTPHIDKFAGKSALFEQAITNGSYTKAAFPPILSSTYASCYQGPFASMADRPMLAKLLQERGFVSGGFTANHLLGKHIDYDTGFEHFEEVVPAHDDRLLLRMKGSQRLLRSNRVNRLMMQVGVNTTPNSVYVKGDVLTRRAISWLEKQEDPFFLWAHYMDTHWPYHLESSLLSGEGRARAWRDRYTVRRNELDNVVPPKQERDYLLALYDSSILFVDAQVGQLLDYLTDGRALDNSLVILTSDHGEAFWEHGLWQHGAKYDFHEEILRVPLLIRLPGQTESVRIRDQVSLMDVAPTILDAVGIETNELMEGQSLLPMLNGQERVVTPLIITEMMDTDWYCLSLRTENFKYIYDENDPDNPELFDLRSDPDELINVYGQYQEVEEFFRERLLEHLEFVESYANRTEDGRWARADQVAERLRALGYIE